LENERKSRKPGYLHSLQTQADKQWKELQLLMEQKQIVTPSEVKTQGTPPRELITVNLVEMPTMRRPLNMPKVINLCPRRYKTQESGFESPLYKYKSRKVNSLSVRHPEYKIYHQNYFKSKIIWEVRAYEA